jgi:uncharacterized protein
VTAEERRRARDILDLQEGTGPVPVLDGAGALALLAAARRIAIVGASTNAGRPGAFVMRALLDAGYECVPVNPFATAVNGVPAYPTLEAATAATGRFDLVDVFRRPEHCPAVARDAVAAGAGALWLQVGIVSWEAARIAHGAGLPVVMDRCTAVEIRRLPGREAR